jgi:hypothetical protein
MLKLHVLQAEFGDCLVLEYGTPRKPRYILVDGGPPQTYERVLRGVLADLPPSHIQFDAVILSHVDKDHIVGLLDLFADLRRQEADGEALSCTVSELWHNSFGRTIDTHGRMQIRLKSLLAIAGAGQHMQTASESFNGIGDGNSLRLAALTLKIPINPGFPGDLICVETAEAPRTIGNLELTVVGPTQENLKSLAAEWEEWLESNEEAVRSGDPFAMANSDRSIPNLSSIMILAKADGKRVLLTGDGRSDHLLQGLGRVDLLDVNGKMHVDVLKLPHHGSSRNITKTFFRKITADCYVVSANGKDGNPDLAALIWLVEAAREQARSVEIICTNPTVSTSKLEEEYPPRDFGYRLRFLEDGRRSITLDIA